MGGGSVFHIGSLVGGITGPIFLFAFALLLSDTQYCLYELLLMEIRFMNHGYEIAGAILLR